MRDTRGGRLALFTLATALTLAGCGGQPTQPTVDTGPTQPPSTDLEPTGPDYVPGMFAPYLNEAEQALGEEHWLTAIAALQKVPENLPPGTDNYRRTYLQARVTLQRGDANAALQSIDRLLAQPIDRDLRQRSLHFRRHLLQLSGRHLESARMQAGQINPDLPPEELVQLRKRVWLDLQRVPPADLSRARAATEVSDWQGWLALATLDASSGTDVNQLRQSLLEWQLTYPEHPCAEELPGGLDAFLEEPASVERIVLMLPLSGRLAAAGKAVRDGYLAAWYEAVGRGWQAPALQLVDLDRSESAQQAYAAAVAEGSNLVIGPLSKGRVAELANDPARSVPVLALNRLDQPAFQGSAALVQMSLAPEDEARELARLAFSRGHRQVLLLHPSARWGNEMAAAFSAEWQRLGARITASAGYSGQEDFSSTVEAALALPESQARARRVRQVLAANVEFTPRRRDDLDAVVVLARGPDEARALKPLLAYHYAGGLPVFSTSHASQPDAPAAANADLNGMTILEMPWLIEANDLRTQLEQSGEADYSRMQALGADAFLLQARFPQLRGGPELALRGQTGLLTLDPQLRITRTLSPAVFDRGTIKPASLY